MANMNTLLVCLIFFCQVSYVTAASECTGAILASVFGTIGTILVIAAIAALVWYCCRKKSGTLSSRSSVDTASEPEISLGTKTKGGDIGLNGHGTPVTFSHRYSEEAPSAAYNTRGVVNPAFGGSHEVLIDMPPQHEEFKIDMDGSPSIRLPSHKGNVKIDLSGHPGIKPPSSREDVKLDMDWDPSLNTNLTNGNPPDLNLPEGKLPDVDLPESELSANGLSGGSLPGADADVIIQSPAKPTFNVDGSTNLEITDVELERPEQGGFGLLIARDKNLPPPALFINEVTPGGAAAKTGLMEKGDKIIGINGVSIEGMPYDRAMSLLRDNEKPKLQLTLLKNALYKGKDASLDLPKGPVEGSCKIDMEPTLEAGLPSVEIEGLQGDAPGLREVDISAVKPGLDASGPQVDTPEGKLKTQVSGPNVYSNIDLDDPSSDLNLPPPKTKRGKCFSCVSSGEKDEPYSKGKVNAGLDFDRTNLDGSIDMKTDRKIGAGSGPEGERLELHAMGPKGSVPSTSASGNLPGPSVEGDDFEINRKVHLGGDKANSQPKKIELHASAPEVEIPKSNQQGNIEISGPNVALPHVSAKVPEQSLNGDQSINAQHIETPGKKLKPEISGIDVDVPAGKLQGRRPQFEDPSAKLDVPSSKKKRSSCFTCAGDGDKDDSYRKTKGNVGYDFNGPDGSLEMKNVDTFGFSRSGPELEGTGMNKEFELRATGPDFDMSRESRGISTGTSDIAVNTRGPEINAPEVSNEDLDFDISGPDVSISRTQPVSLHTKTQTIAAPKAKQSTQMSGPDVPTMKIKDPKERPDVPSTNLNFSSSKKKRGNCLSCTGGADKDEPYRKTKGDAQFGLNGPEVQGSTNGSGLDIDTEKPSKGFDANAPEFKEKGKIRVETSRPDVDVRSRNIRDPKANTIDSSADLPPASRKKPRGNCLSCTGNAENDEPYGRAEGRTQFDFDGQDANGSLELEKPAISKHDTALGGKATGPDFDIDTPDVNVSAQQPRSGFKSPEFDVQAGGVKAIDVHGPAFSYDKPNITEPSLGKTNEGFDIPASNRGINAPNTDESFNTPDTGVKSPEFNVPKLGASAEIDARPNVNAPDFNTTKGRLQTEISRPNVDVQSGTFKGPDANLQDPSANLPPSSKRKLRGNCLSCTGGADKDEPYGRAKGNNQFDIGGQNLDGSAEMKKSGVDEPTIDMDGRAVGPESVIDTPDIDVSSKSSKSGLKSPEFDVPKARGGGAMEVDGPAFSYDKPNISEPSLGKTNEGFDIPASNRGINIPDIDVKSPDTGVKSPEFVDSKRGASGEIDVRSNVNAPDFNTRKGKLQTEISKPNVHAPSGDISGPDASLQGPSAKLPSNRGINIPDIDVKSPDTGVKSPEFVDSKRGASGEIDVRSNVNAPDFNTRKGKLQTEISKPNVHAPSGDISGPDASLQGPSAKLPSSSKRKLRGNCLSCTGGADKDEPYGKPQGHTQFDFDGPDLDGSVEMKGIGEPEVEIDGEATGQNFDMSTPDIDLSSKKTENGFSSGVNAPKRAVSGEDIAGLHLSYEKPKVSGPSLEKTEEYRNPDFGINSSDIEPTDKTNIGFSPPGLDVPKTKGAGQIDLTARHLSYEKPNISGPSIGQRGQENDILRLDIDTPQGLGDLGIHKPDFSVPSKYGDIACEDLAIEANLPDKEIATTKREFGRDTNGLDIDIAGAGKNLEVVKPSVSTLHADTSECKPTIGLEMNGLGTDHTGVDLNRPQLDVTSKQRYGVHMAGLDTPVSDYSFPPIDDKEESCEPLEIKEDKGNDFDPKFNWGINTSTPKAPKATKQLIGLPRGEINLAPCPVEDDISVANACDTLDLHSTPQPAPSAAFDEPYSLQRYDEIRPEMELRLLPPAEVNKSDQSYELDILNNSDEKAKNSWKPGSMKLVKVEENVTVCSASVEETESHSPRNRTLTLDREIRRKIEVEFPKEEKQKPSSSSSSSSSSDSDGQNEEKPKRKKKSRLLKAIRKSSSSSASSKEGRTSKKKETESRSSSSDDEEVKTKQILIKRDVTPSSREGHALLKQDSRESKQSTSSSSEDEDVVRKTHPSKDDVFLVKTTGQTKTRTTSASSSSDEEPPSLHGKVLPKQKSSKNSSSSDNGNHDGEKQLLLAQPTFEKEELEEPAQSISKVQEDMPTAVSSSVTPASDYHFAADKPDDDIKPKERKSSTSSSSDEESKSPMVYKVEYSMYRQQYVVEPESEPNKPVQSVADIQKDAPEVVLNSAKSADPEFLSMSDMQTKSKGRKDSSSSSSSSSAEEEPTIGVKSVKLINPDLHFLAEKPNDEIMPKERKSSSSCSSDEESNSPVVYEVEDRMLQQQSVLKPESEREKPVLSVADIKDVAPEDVLHPAEPKDAEIMFTLDAPNRRKTSASSSSSSDSVKPVNQDLSRLVEKPDDEMKPKEWKISLDYPSERESRSPEVYKVEYTTYQKQYPEESKGESDHPLPSVKNVQDSPEMGSHSVNPTDTDFIFMPDSQTNLKERKRSTSSSSSSDAEHTDDYKDPEKTDVQDPKEMVDNSLPPKYFVSYNIKKPDFPQNTEKQLPQEIKSSTSSSSEEIDNSTHSLDLTVYRYETVHHVIASEFPPNEQETNSSDVKENSFVVVSRSFKRPSPDIWSTTIETQDEPQAFSSSTDVQFSEPPYHSTYHLEYPFNHPEVDEDESAQIQEEGIVPVYKSPSADHDMSDVSAQLESPDEDGTVDQNTQSPHAWNIHAHTFETVYQVTIPDSPATDETSLEVQELAPTVVTRSVKRTSPDISDYDNLGVEPQVSTSSTEVQFSEPSNDFEIDYPKTEKVSATNDQDVSLTDEEWIMKHTVERETPDISALLAAFDHPKEEAQLSRDSRNNTEDEDISPSEKSPKDIVRRGSSSRLWDLMQGYLIEQHIPDDGGANTEYEPEKRVEKEEPELEITESISTVESSVPVLNQQTETLHEVTHNASNVVTYKILLGDKEPSKEVTTSITKVERSVSEVTPTVSKFDPVNVQVDVADKTPVVKEYTTSHWRKQISVPVDVDNDEDPWMRHHSKGLQRATSYQVMSTKSPESETSLAQSRSLSLSKVPHVKGVKTSTEKELQRTRYSIESRARTEPTVYRVTTERRPFLRELEAVPRVRTNENVFSIKDGKTQSPKTQTGTAKEESPRGTSDSGLSVQSLRSLWNK